MKKIFIVIFALVVLGFSYKLTIYTLLSIYSFLALTRPVDTNVLIVEGWLSGYMLDAAAKEIKTGEYKYVITTGIEESLPKTSSHSSLRSEAEYCKKILSERGIDASMIYAVSAMPATWNKTFHTALAIKPWLEKRHIRAVNVFTGGPHARKSLTLFQKALGKDIKVGVISGKIKHHDTIYWWTSLGLAKVTVRYFFGYIYALAWRFW